MKSRKLRSGLLALCAFGAIPIIDNASAQSFQTRGFNDASLPVLHRAGATDPTNVAALLSARFCTDCSTQTTTQSNQLRIAGSHSSLIVTVDGASAKFEDEAVHNLAHSLAKSVADKMSDAALEQAGRTFIAAKLADVIVLGPGEELVLVRTDYRIEGQQNLSTGEITRSVAANRIVFGRTIHGVPVVGNGSTVVLTFLNNGSLESFRYDWPKYQATASQNLVDSNEILSRIQTVIGVRTHVIPNFAVTTPARLDASHPVALTSETSLQKLECGYYDPGTRSGKSVAIVQPGCTYRVVWESANGMRQGYAGAVPAGGHFEADSTWMEAGILGESNLSF
ncbi:MAG: hypothetical protein WAK33_20440 [Silvibacterium sp.]